MFNTNKTFEIILHVREALSKYEKYILYCKMTAAELVELQKHFNVEQDGLVNETLYKYIFTNKQ